MVWKYEDLEHMTKDFHRSSIGRYIVDVGWYPEQDPRGEFRCLVILDQNWETPQEKLVTRDPEEMQRWVTKQMQEACRRSGT